MASLIYNRALELWARGSIDFDTDTFKVMLTTSAYTEDKDAHDFRNDVTNEVTGTGYTAGGNTVTVSVTLDTANDRFDLVIPQVTWTSSTIANARKFIVYKSRGGAASADELVCCIDNGSDVSTSSGTLTLNSSTIRFPSP